MARISANELKIKGVSALKPLLQQDRLAVITVRGKNRYVVMDIDLYNRLRENELHAALVEVRQDLASGRFKSGSVDDHMRRIDGDV